jgi:hypothetical protein
MRPQLRPTRCGNPACERLSAQVLTRLPQSVRLLHVIRRSRPCACATCSAHFGHVSTSRRLSHQADLQNPSPLSSTPSSPRYVPRPPTPEGKEEEPEQKSLDTLLVQLHIHEPPESPFSNSNRKQVIVRGNSGKRRFYVGCCG